MSSELFTLSKVCRIRPNGPAVPSGTPTLQREVFRPHHLCGRQMLFSRRLLIPPASLSRRHVSNMPFHFSCACVFLMRPFWPCVAFVPDCSFSRRWRTLQACPLMARRACMSPLAPRAARVPTWVPDQSPPWMCSER